MCLALLRENTPSSLDQTFLESAEMCRFTDTADVTLPHVRMYHEYSTENFFCPLYLRQCVQGLPK